MGIADTVSSRCGNLPSVTVVIGIEGRPVAQVTSLEVIFEGFTRFRIRSRGVATVRVEAMFKHPLNVVTLGGRVFSDFVNGSPVIARLILPFNGFAPFAHTCAVHHSDLAEVMLALYERCIVRFVG